MTWMSTTFRVGNRFRCRISFDTPIEDGDIVTIEARWTPKRPRRLTKGEVRDYRLGRDRFLAEIADQIGARGMLVEL